MYDLEELEKLVVDGEVAKRSHPTKDLFIYSYLKTFYPEWTETLRWARGLVLNSKGERIACPFKKFFNYSEIKSEIDELIASGIGNRIQEKVDGSLGILFFYDGEWIITTKGSFTSSQAFEASLMLMLDYSDALKKLDKQYTYLFEIIYPDNQIVVSYDFSGLILLAIMDPITMQEVKIENAWPHIVKHYTDLSISDIIADLSRPDYCSAEGFVVVFDNGVRAKFKYDEYVRLHKIISDFKPKQIIEFMKSGSNIDDLISSLPDEFRADIIDVKERTEAMYYDICDEIFTYFEKIKSPNKKTFALEAVKHKFKAHLFELWKYYYTQEPIGVAPTIEWAKNQKYFNEMVYDSILEINDRCESKIIEAKVAA